MGMVMDTEQSANPAGSSQIGAAVAVSSPAAGASAPMEGDPAASKHSPGFIRAVIVASALLVAATVTLLIFRDLMTPSPTGVLELRGDATIEGAEVQITALGSAGRQIRVTMKSDNSFRTRVFLPRGDYRVRAMLPTGEVLVSTVQGIEDDMVTVVNLVARQSSQYREVAPTN